MNCKDIQNQKTLLNRRDRHSMDWAILLAIVLHIGILYLPPVAHLDSHRDWETPKKEAIDFHFIKPPPPPQEQPPEPRTVKKQVYPKFVPNTEPFDPGNMVIDDTYEIVLDPRDIEIIDPGLPPEEPLMVGGNVMSPRAIHQVPPRYPDQARRLRIEGKVEIRAVISKTGTVTEARVVRSLFSLCDEAALEAVRQWTFSPGTQNDVPVNVVMLLSVEFRLN